MSAVLSEREHMTGLDRSYVNSKLNAWGHWMERHAEVNGYPHQDNVTAYMAGAGGGSKGHRVLCLDMPEDIAKTHLKVLYTLTEAEREAVFLYYVVRMKPDGTMWELNERCSAAGVSRDALKKRLQSARMKIMGLIDGRVDGAKLVL